MKAVRFYYVDDVMQILGLGKSQSYAIIKELNAELKTKGYITICSGNSESGDRV